MTHHQVAATPGDAAALALHGRTRHRAARPPTATARRSRPGCSTARCRWPSSTVRCAGCSTARRASGCSSDPYVDAPAATALFDTPEQRALARRAAAASVVLLTNDGVLPLAARPESIAVIGPSRRRAPPPAGRLPLPGPRRDHLRERGLDPAPGERQPRSFQAGPHYTDHVTPLAALRATYGERVVHERGCGVTGDDDGGIAAAVAAAQRRRRRDRLRRRRVGSAAALDGRRGPRRHLARPHRRAAAARRRRRRHRHADGGGAGERSRPRGARDRGRARPRSCRRGCPARRAATGSSTSSPAGSTRPGGCPCRCPARSARCRCTHRPGPAAAAACSTATTPTARRRRSSRSATASRTRRFERGDLTVEASGSTAEPVVLSIDTRNTSDRAGTDVVQLVAQRRRGVGRSPPVLPVRLRQGGARSRARGGPCASPSTRAVSPSTTRRCASSSSRVTSRSGSGTASVRVPLRGEVCEYRQKEIVATAVDIGRSRG